MEKREGAGMDYYREYAVYLEMEKKASPNTQSSYLRDVRNFLQWLLL